MTTLPPLPPEVTAEAVESLPGRLAKKLDDILTVARTWPVTRSATGWEVKIDDQTLVRITDPPTDPSSLACSCLLAPRCLHRAAVASLSPTADEPPTLGLPATDPTPDAPDHSASNTDRAPATPDLAGAAGAEAGARIRAVTDAEKAAAGALGRVAAELLVTGASGAGAVAQAALLRAAHGARALRMPRAASAAVRVVEHLRAAHRDDPGFRLDDLVDDLRELLSAARGIGLGRALHGTARREYHLVDNARLTGVACEPVVTASGYAGAVAHLVDGSGRFFQVGAVLPGGVASAVARADTPVSVGEARLTPRELGRAGLLGVDLRASADGRIGTGRDARAVRATGHAWRAGPLAASWGTPWKEQVGRYREALSLPIEERPAGHDLLLLDGTAIGYADGGVAFHTGGASVTLVAPLDAPELGYVDNLRLLGRFPGRPMSVLGRPVGRGRVAAIAFTADWLPAHLPHHVDLGLDRLVRADLTPAGATTVRAGNEPPEVEPAGPPSPPLHLIGRVLERAVEAGRVAVVSRPEDAARLRAAAMPYAAELLAALEHAARPARDVFGRARDGDTEAYADAWLDAAVYVHAARLSADYG
jgi:hypothetical protein